MKNLEDIVREAATEGWLSGTRIDRDQQGRWQVSAPSRFGTGHSIEIDADPVVALRNALLPYGAIGELSAAEMEE